MAKYYGKKYKSGDPVVDWIFRRFIDLLNTEVKTIVIKRRLKHSDGSLLDGMWDEHEKTLYVNPSKHHPELGRREWYDVTMALIHELCHVLWKSVPERNIAQMELMLIDKFTLAQKHALKRFLPKTPLTNQ